MFCAPARMATFTPTTSPRRLNSGPPLLPGLIGVCVWMSDLYDTSLFSVTSRLSALTVPVVTVCSYPKALPTAITFSASNRSAAVPSGTTGSGLGGSILMRARSDFLVGGDARGRWRTVPSASLAAERLHVIDNVVVGDDVPAGVEHDAGAHAVHPLRLHPGRLERVVRPRSPSARCGCSPPPPSPAPPVLHRLVPPLALRRHRGDDAGVNGGGRLRNRWYRVGRPRPGRPSDAHHRRENRPIAYPASVRGVELPDPGEVVSTAAAARLIQRSETRWRKRMRPTAAGWCRAVRVVVE